MEGPREGVRRSEHAGEDEFLGPEQRGDGYRKQITVGIARDIEDRRTGSRDLVGGLGCFQRARRLDDEVGAASAGDLPRPLNHVVDVRVEDVLGAKRAASTRLFSTGSEMVRSVAPNIFITWAVCNPSGPPPRMATRLPTFMFALSAMRTTTDTFSRRPPGHRL